MHVDTMFSLKVCPDWFIKFLLLFHDFLLNYLSILVEEVVVPRDLVTSDLAEVMTRAFDNYPSTSSENASAATTTTTDTTASTSTDTAVETTAAAPTIGASTAAQASTEAVPRSNNTGEWNALIDTSDGNIWFA